jgi:hypothetical protein
MKPPAVRSFTEAEFLDECVTAGFIGCYKFWIQLKPHADDRTRANAEGLLKALAQFTWEINGRRSRSPEQREAFSYCGLENPTPPGRSS